MDKQKLENCIRYFEKLKQDGENNHPFSQELTEIFYLLDSDFNYFENKQELDRSKKRIEEMNLDELSTYLTFIERGDRLVEGMFEDYIEDGTILEILYQIRKLIN